MKHAILLRETQPGRYEAIAKATDEDLTPIAVMQANMEFFHTRAAQLLATIMALPLRDEATADQLQAFHDMAGLIRCRELAQGCARDLARYTHAPMAATAPAIKSGAAGMVAGAAIEHIPTPKAVSDAFARAAAGLPPEPRRRL